MLHRIKYLIQIAFYIILIFQRSKGEGVNVAKGFGLKQRYAKCLSTE